ncbi:DUF6279 family lipoprotein [Vibrio sp. S4M6]|uniref:DUF6279 family lipoprotein n=1 Tax=Vibrio sinus TaxID=2946865 RepID=UPI002029CAC9|nr:DUF6279 family lipoprotein [Vibrio sinus]MCL9780017.1 DUF6279 family lipoprotein [Vibrio sinus]
MKQWIGLLLSLFCFGCSTQIASQFVYSNADWLTVRYLEEYVELTGEQEEIIKRKTRLYAQWHQQNELPLYSEQLEYVAQISPQHFTEEDLLSLQASIKERVQVLVEKAAPDILTLTRSLSDSQVNDFMAHITEKHRKTAARLNEREQSESRNRYAIRIQETTEEWLGSVNSDQKQAIESWAQDILATSNEWIEYQSNLRLEIEKLLANRQNPTYLMTNFNQLIYFPETYYPAGLKKKRAHNLSVANKYIVTIIRSMDEKQTKHLREELLEWHELILALQS